MKPSRNRFYCYDCGKTKMLFETEKKALAALERQKKQYQRQNEYIKGSFDRVSVTLPKGTKERIKATGQSVNSFINNVVKKELEKKG